MIHAQTHTPHTHIHWSHTHTHAHTDHSHVPHFKLMHNQGIKDGHRHTSTPGRGISGCKRLGSPRKRRRGWPDIAPRQTWVSRKHPGNILWRARGEGKNGIKGEEDMGTIHVDISFHAPKKETKQWSVALSSHLPSQKPLTPIIARPDLLDLVPHDHVECERVIFILRYHKSPRGTCQSTSPWDERICVCVCEKPTTKITGNAWPRGEK